MAPLSFTKLFSQRSSSASTASSQARSSFDAFEPESYVIALPSIHTTSNSLTPISSGTSSSGSIGAAEMLDDENLAWGRPSRSRGKHSHGGRVRW
ncbi:hypothetical protein GY45DRAFT_1366312 [Cubamyces sp. BRFM 1775]|nr:hypothetical protein GY45DRAFT_1366312 [Cubamyces sp. BRFM 1775]